MEDMGGCKEKNKSATKAFCALSAEFYENIALFRQKCRVGNRLCALSFMEDMGGCKEKNKSATKAFCALSAEFYENIALFRQKCRVGNFP